MKSKNISKIEEGLQNVCNKNIEEVFSLESALIIYRLTQQAITMHRSLKLGWFSFLVWPYEVFPERRGGIAAIRYLQKHEKCGARKREEMRKDLGYWSRRYYSIKRELVHW